MTKTKTVDSEQIIVPRGYPPTPDGRVFYVVGDIHGRRDLLERVHLAIDRDKERQPNGRVSLPDAGTRGDTPYGLNASPDAPHATIGPDLVIRGRVEAKGALQIQGQVFGDVHAARIVVGRDATIEGTLVAADVQIDGRVEGTVRGNSLTIGSNACVKADVLHRTLSIADGCHFEGRARQSDDPLSDRHSGNLLKASVEIYLGDYIDRGDDSRGVIDMLLSRSRNANTVFVRGNHEQFLLDFLAGDLDFAMWKQVGALATLLSYGIQPGPMFFAKSQDGLRSALQEALTQRHASFFSETIPYFQAGPYLFVHAGLRPGLPLEQQRREDLMGIRREFLDCEDDFGYVVVHGHTPGRAPEFRPNRINLDTGAYSTGRLTCLRIGPDGLQLLDV